MLYNKNDRVIVRASGQHGTVKHADDKIDAFMVEIDGDLIKCRGAELAPESRRASPPRAR